MKTDFETAKSILERELKDAPYVKNGLLEGALPPLKVMDFVIQAVIANKDKSECMDVFRKILNDNKIEDKYEASYSSIVEQFFEILKRYKENCG